MPNNAAKQYYVVGYKGTSPYDAGIFYCPYVPLQMVRAVGENTFQPKIGFKTRYGIAQNPFATSDYRCCCWVPRQYILQKSYKSQTLCNHKKTYSLNLRGSFVPLFLYLNSNNAKTTKLINK